MKTLLIYLGQFLIASAFGLAGAWLIVWGLDEEERQVRMGVSYL